MQLLAVFRWSTPRVAYVAIFVGALVSIAGHAQTVQPNAGVSFAQLGLPGHPESGSSIGQVFVDAGMFYGGGYINVERYENGHAVAWVVRNLAVESGPSPADVSAQFDLGATDRQYSLSAYVEFSPSPLPDDSSLQDHVPMIYLMSQLALPADNNPNQFQDVVCYKDDAKFWAGQLSVMAVQVTIDLAKLQFGDGTGWIIKGRDPSKTLMITASHNFTDRQVPKTSATVNYQKKTCGGKETEDFFPGDVDEVLERNTRLDFVIVSLKPPEGNRKYPPPLQALYREIKLNDVVTIPQHPAEVIPFKQAGYYYDIANKKRCYITPTAAINAKLGEIDAKCGAVHGTSGSPLLDATDSKEATPYAIGLIVGCRLEKGSECKPLSAAGYKMGDICDFDAGPEGKKLLDCKKP